MPGAARYNSMMGEPRKKADWPVVVSLVLAVVLVPLAVYICGYFGSSELQYVASSDAENPYYREFSHNWQVTIYTPAVRVEAIIRGRRMYASSAANGDISPPLSPIFPPT